MAEASIVVPEGGERITIENGRLQVPDNPIVPFIEGDGTGPDIWRATVRVLDAAVEKAYGGQRKIHWMEIYAGEKANNLLHTWLPEASVDACREFLVSIKGPLTTPVGGGIRSLNVALRQLLDLYVCLRPVRWFNGVPSPVRDPGSVDMVIFRENTEDIYAGIEFERGSEDNDGFLELLKEHFPDRYAKIRFPDSCGIGLKPVSQEGTERLVRAAIEYGIANGRKSVTFVHKGNIMKFTEGAFRNWGYELAERDYPDHTYTWGQWERTAAASGVQAANEEQAAALGSGKILIKDAIADITLQQVLTRPKEFDIIATLNLNGDYLSDALAAQVGGIGIAPGGNINYDTGHAVFEATHGTAPKYANLDKVNPGSLILSGEMMLRYMGWTEAADRIIDAMDKTIASKTVTYDFARLMEGAIEVKCSEFGDALIANLEASAPVIRVALIEGVGESQLAAECARTIRGGFASYNADFRGITRRARRVFEEQDWQAGRADSVERIELYEQHVHSMIETLREMLGERVQDHELWKRIKSEFAEQIRDYVDLEFTKTYFSSITRRIFGTVGIDPAVEFIALDYRPMESIKREPPLNVYEIYSGRSSRDVFLQLLDEYSYNTGWQDLRHSVTFLDRQLAHHSAALGGVQNVARLEFIRPVFYQNTRAYIVGRAVARDGAIQPLVISLHNTGAGISVDAVLTNSADVSMLFGFTRSYFHVDLETVTDAVLFLRSIMPHKPVAEMFTVLGRAKQGKTERYRSFFRHLQQSTDLIVEAPGDKGMVMLVFTLPSYDVVFKIIRDKFAYPKTVVRKDVLNKYQLVFKHDRAGRLVDAQEFRMLRFRVNRFEPKLLEELLNEASETCKIEDDRLVVNHLYVERRMTPLNLYLREAAPLDARAAVLDYGQAIRDLSATNIFPGDLLLKNFGVTRNGRVIFYDYDELCLVTECNFREMPQPASLEEEMQAEAWFYVGEDDVFPEQFASFLGLEPEHLEIFLEAHSDLLTAAYWRDMKERHLRGEVPEVLPYRPSLIAPPPGSLD